MRTLTLENGDLVMQNGTFATISGDAELAQSVENALLTAKGEWFLDEEHGLERDALLGKGFNEGEATDAIIEAVTQDERIASVEDILFTFNRQTRTLTVSMKLRKTEDEVIDLEVEI